MSRFTVAVRTSLAALGANDERVLFARASSDDAEVRARTATIIARVRSMGDAALRDLALEFDGQALDALEVPRARWVTALASLDPSVRRALERAAANIRLVHEAFRPIPSEVRTADGVVIGRRPDPLARVGVYAPGGRATYPSSLLMGAIPARVVGVGEVIVCSPPARATGVPSDVLLAAAAIAGVDRVFAIGGAGAIAALAYGTESVPQVDRIVGPGNAYVAEAKSQVAGRVGIDAPAGPSELLVIADASATPEVIARELLAQAEHDPAAAVVLVALDSAHGTADAFIARVWAVLIALVDAEPRADVIRESFAARGALLTARTLDEATTFANRWAAEHLMLALAPDTQQRALDAVRNTGTVFLGETASVAFGDYLSGANHVLPTGGLARAWSGLSTLDFVRWTTWQRIDRASARAMAHDVGILADAEQLPAHAAAARQWEGA